MVHPIFYGLTGLVPVAVIIHDRLYCAACGERKVRRDRPTAATVIRWDEEAAGDVPGICTQCGALLRERV